MNDRKQRADDLVTDLAARAERMEQYIRHGGMVRLEDALSAADIIRDLREEQSDQEAARKRHEELGRYLNALSARLDASDSLDMDRLTATLDSYANGADAYCLVSREAAAALRSLKTQLDDAKARARNDLEYIRRLEKSAEGS